MTDLTAASSAVLELDGTAWDMPAAVVGCDHVLVPDNVDAGELPGAPVIGELIPRRDSVLIIR